MSDSLRVIRYDGVESVAFGPLSEYRALVNDDYPDLPIRTGIQTARPGYQTKPHWHPYVEILHILEGTAEAWQQGVERSLVTLRPGDTLVIPARTLHAFKVTGEQTLRLLGTHLSDRRIVHYEDGTVSVGAGAAQALGRPTLSRFLGQPQDGAGDRGGDSAVGSAAGDRGGID